MAIVHMMIPEEFSNETKNALIAGTKEALSKALEVPTPAAISIFTTEFPRNMMCEDAAKKHVLIVYTKEGKPLSQKRAAAELFEKVCADVLGEKKGDTFIIFKEHSWENLCVRGKLRMDM